MLFYTIALVFTFLIWIQFPKGNSIAVTLHQRYGEPTLVKFHGFEKLNRKFNKVTLDIRFLQSCFDHQVIPKFLQIHVSNRKLQKL